MICLHVLGSRRLVIEFEEANSRLLLLLAFKILNVPLVPNNLHHVDVWFQVVDFHKLSYEVVECDEYVRMLFEDLERGILPLTEDELSAEDAWNSVYVHMPEFIMVAFSQFEARLKDHRKQVTKLKVAASTQQDAFERDRGLHPRRTHDRRGRLVFDMSSAKAKLREDVSNDAHLNTSPTRLHRSRPEYQQFSLDEFRPRIYQEVRRQKFIYYLACKRAQKQQQRGLPDTWEESSEEEDG